MQALIVLAHPEAKSFNAQLASTAKDALQTKGYFVDFIDLYRQGFDPLESGSHFDTRANSGYFNAMIEQRHGSDNNVLPSDVEQAIVRLEAADLVILQFPLWWWSMPAVLKGWFDRVFVWGRVYSSKKRYRDCGHFKGKHALISVTTGAPQAAFGPDGRAGDINLVLWHVHFSLSYVGFSVLPPFCSFGIGTAPLCSQEEDRLFEHHKNQFRVHLERLATLEPLKFNSSADWDASGRLLPSAPSYGPLIRHSNSDH